MLHGVQVAVREWYRRHVSLDGFVTSGVYIESVVFSAESVMIHDDFA